MTRSAIAQLFVGLLLVAATGCRTSQGPQATSAPTTAKATAKTTGPPAHTQPVHANDDRPAAEPGPQQQVTGPGETLSAADNKLRQQGLEALDAGRYTVARRIFDELLQRNRANAAIQALQSAAASAESDTRAGVASVLARMPAKKLAAPPWTYTLRKAASIPEQARAPKLVKASQKRNQVTDDAEWFAEHKLKLPMWSVPNDFMNVAGDLPANLPDHYGDLKLFRAISHPDHSVLLYGEDFSGGTVLGVIGSAGQVRSLLDFESWRTAPVTKRGDAPFVDQRITWAQVVSGVLYVSTGHHTYASSSGGRNAYLSAIDLDSGDLLWRSQPLVGNAMNFEIRDGWILTGYGFTAEPDFLYVLDATNGKVKSKVKVKSGPSVVLLKGDQLFVRCYDTDYVFDLR
ncbi:MAG: hypothetical protein JKY37_10575 [Nannocystaceae bacterium]|nr:hypothetical protein [Nannocystaceae bacterium]